MKLVRAIGCSRENVTVEAGKVYRLRIINTGSLTYQVRSQWICVALQAHEQCHYSPFPTASCWSTICVWHMACGRP